MSRVFTDCRGWGNHISWTSWQKRLVYGHHTPVPEVGDFWEHKMQSGKIMVFKFTSVTRDSRVADYFEATVTDCGYKDGLPDNYQEVLGKSEWHVPALVFWLFALSGILTGTFAYFN